jgi:hypothetical protein
MVLVRVVQRGAFVNISLQTCVNFGYGLGHGLGRKEVSKRDKPVPLEVSHGGIDSRLACGVLIGQRQLLPMGGHTR